MKTAYICDNCHKASELRPWIFHCIECGKEICENCMQGYATCKECAVGKTEGELEARFDAQRADNAQHIIGIPFDAKHCVIFPISI